MQSFAEYSLLIASFSHTGNITTNHNTRFFSYRNRLNVFCVIVDQKKINYFVYFMLEIFYWKYGVERE
jgi:hypothetical protein